jgi:hypothetical protein
MEKVENLEVTSEDEIPETSLIYRKGSEIGFLPEIIMVAGIPIFSVILTFYGFLQTNTNMYVVASGVIVIIDIFIIAYLIEDTSSFAFNKNNFYKLSRAGNGYEKDYSSVIDNIVILKEDKVRVETEEKEFILEDIERPEEIQNEVYGM